VRLSAPAFPVDHPAPLGHDGQGEVRAAFARVESGPPQPPYLKRTQLPRTVRIAAR